MKGLIKMKIQVKVRVTLKVKGKVNVRAPFSQPHMSLFVFMVK